MRCEEIMKRDVLVVSPRDTVLTAAKLMRDENVGFLPVRDESGRALGAITDRDLVIRVLAAGEWSDIEIDEVMTRDVVACRPDDDVEEAYRLMVVNQTARIMCVDENGQLSGVISLSDLAAAPDDGDVVFPS